MEILLEENERIDPVNDNLRLIQKVNGLTFGTDALLLAAFVKKNGKRALELGGGSGIISLLLATRKRFEEIDCLELQEEYVALIRRNLSLNGKEKDIHAISGDVRSFPETINYGTYDAVFTNPPYMTKDCGAHCQDVAKNTARHEMNGSIYDFALCAGRALRYGGAFYVVYPPERLADLITACRNAKLEPKRVVTVHARKNAPPSLLLLEARAGGKPGLLFSPPLVLTDNGVDSDDMRYVLENGKMPDKF